MSEDLTPRLLKGLLEAFIGYGIRNHTELPQKSHSSYGPLTNLKML